MLRSAVVAAATPADAVVVVVVIAAGQPHVLRLPAREQPLAVLVPAVQAAQALPVRHLA